MAGKTVEANLIIEVVVDCPHCDKYLNLLDTDDTAHQDLNEDGAIIKQACPYQGHWLEAHEKFEVKSVRCSGCGEFFSVKGLAW